MKSGRWGVTLKNGDEMRIEIRKSVAVEATCLHKNIYAVEVEVKASKMVRDSMVESVQVEGYPVDVAMVGGLPVGTLEFRVVVPKRRQGVWK